MPNDPYPILLLGYIDRRQGLWDKSIKRFEHALDLDPRNLSVPQTARPDLYQSSPVSGGRKATRPSYRAGARRPELPRPARHAVELDWHANTKPLHSTIDLLLAKDPGNASVAFRIVDILVPLRERYEGRR